MSQSINRLKEKHNIEVEDSAIRMIFETIQLNYLNKERYLFDMEQFDIHLIFTTEDCYFVTTDNPVFVRGIDIENANFKGILWCPVTPNILVSLSKKEHNNCLNIYHHIVTKETIKDFNSIILQNAINYFVSSSEITDMKELGFRFIYN